jgi:adenylyltransferase/sulfurtransferase
MDRQSRIHAMLRPMPRQIAVAELARLLASGTPVRLIDVRAPWEHARAHLPASTLIPLPELEERWSELLPLAGERPATEGEPARPGELLVTYCHHGVRSLGAAALLEAKGIGPVASLAGGIDAWSRLIDPAVPQY